MIGVMEEAKKYSVMTYDSFKAALKKSKAYGDISLQMNAALAMFLTAPPDVREAWIQRMIAAKRTAGSKTALERVTEIVLRNGFSQQEAGHSQDGGDEAGGQPAYPLKPTGNLGGSGGGVSSAELEEEAAKELGENDTKPGAKPQRRPRRSAGR